jgi:hypothetical protein
MDKNHKTKEKKQFYCPLGYGIMWWRGLRYAECPLGPSFRNLQECRDCELKIDEDFLNLKEKVQEYKPRKRKKNKKKK